MYKLLCAAVFSVGSLFAAEQPNYPQLPQKNELREEILKSEPFQTYQLIPPLAPLIAEYADNTVHGYMAIATHIPNHNFAVRFKHMHDQNCREMQRIERPIQMNDWVIWSVLCSSKPGDIHTDWRSHSHELGLPPEIRFPEKIPLALLHNKKEGDSVYFRLCGIPFTLMCNQRALNKEKPENFEQVLEKTEYFSGAQ